MANLTIAVDDETLHNARRCALDQGTSVNALLREYLELYSGGLKAQNQAIHSLLELSAQSESGSGGRRWTRDELHER